MKLKDWQIVQWKFYQAVNWAYWFLEVEWFEEHIFVFGWNKADALDQDIVEAKIKIFKWKFEAEIIRVIRRAERLLMWEFEKPKRINCWFVKPFNPAIKTDIFIPERFINNAKNKDIVVVRILRWDGKNPEWKIVEVLWDKTNPETIINWYILHCSRGYVKLSLCENSCFILPRSYDDQRAAKIQRIFRERESVWNKDTWVLSFNWILDLSSSGMLMSSILIYSE